MHAATLLLVSLACAGYARRVQPNLQEQNLGTSAASNPPSAFAFSGPAVRPSAGRSAVNAQMSSNADAATDASGVDKLLSRFGLPSDDMMMDRRSIVGLGMAASALPLLSNVAPAAAADGMFSLPPLPYAYDALEPHIDQATMKFHHDFHHQAYINNLNKAMAGKAEASLVSLMPKAKEAKLNNAGGGHYNHCLFWNIMGPKAGGEPTGVLAEKMTAAFGSYEDFKAKFSAAAAGVFGSGWAWLAVAKDGSVKIVTTPNQDNPLMEGATEAGLIPIMGIDVWEHAYYLKYQNRRPEYISAFFNVINWAKVGEYYASAASGTPISF